MDAQPPQRQLEPGRFSVHPGDALSFLPGDQGKQAEWYCVLWYCFPGQTAKSCKVKLPRRLIFILQKRESVDTDAGD